MTTRVGLIEKACEWLEEHLQEYWSQKITDPEQFIEEFRKAMSRKTLEE